MHGVSALLGAVPWPAYLVPVLPLVLGVYLLLPGRAERESQRHERSRFPLLTFLRPQVPGVRGTMPPAVVRIQAVVMILFGVAGFALLASGIF